MNRRTAALVIVLSFLLILLQGSSNNAYSQGLVEYSLNVLRFPLNSEVLTFDPSDPDFNNASLYIAYQVYESLFRPAPDGSVVPAGATSYDVSGDGLTYTIHLRPDAYWSNGDPVIAQDYIDAMLRLGSTLYSFLLSPVAGYDEYSQSNPSLVGITSPDDNTIEITLHSPAAHFPYVLATPIVSYPIHDDPGVFNGPYLAELYTSDVWDLERNPQYWDADGVQIEAILMPIIPDLELQFDYYQDGELDVSGYPAQVLPAILEDAALRGEFRILPRPGVFYVGLNTVAEPTNDVNLRRALASAIDRRFLADNVLNEPWRSVATGVLPPELGGDPAGVVGYDFDPVAAQAFLAEYTDTPEDINISLWYSYNSQAITEAIASMWEENLNINVTLQGFTWNDYLNELQSCAGYPATCAYNGYVLGWVVEHADGWSLFSDMYSRNLTATGWSSPVYDGYLDAAAIQTDPALRLDHYKDAEQLIAEDETILIPLNFIDQTLMIKPYVNFEYPLVYTIPFFMNWSLVPNEPLIVDSTADTSIPGDSIFTLREAIEAANAAPGLDIVEFDVPSDTDPGCDALTGICTIQPTSPLPEIIDAVFITGYSQEGATPNSNPIELENNAVLKIQLDGSLAGAGSPGLKISAGNSIIDGLAINHFNGDGIVLSGAANNRIIGNFIGTDATGNLALGNFLNGVKVDGSINNTIGGPLPEWSNLISSNRGNGVEIIGSQTMNNMVQGNRVGTGTSGASFFGNGQAGVRLNDASWNVIRANEIGYNGRDGVTVVGGSATRNTISMNAIHDNFGAGIENLNGGNTELPAPLITAMLGDRIEGTAPFSSTVQLFADADGEGRIYLGSVSADSNGDFSYTGPFDGPNITATATDLAGNSSEFSSPVPWAADNCEFNDLYDDACDVADRIGFSFNGSGVFSSYLSRPDDVDWFAFDLEPGIDIVAGRSLYFTLSGPGGGDLPANFDVAILAEMSEDQTTVPTPLQGVPLQGVPLQGVPLQGVPLQGVEAESVPLQGVPLQGVEIWDIPLQGVPLQGVPLQGVPLQGVPLQGVPLQGVGFHQGVQAEELSTLFRGGMTGRFYVMVWSGTGEFSPSPYEVAVSVDGVTVEACQTGIDLVDLNLSLSEPIGNVVDPSTLFLVNQSRMAALYGQDSSQDLLVKLVEVANHNAVNGLIVDLGQVGQADGEEPTFPALQAAYADWDENGCDIPAANIVTREIKSVILEFLEEYDTIENLVLVGNDKVIPFRRVPDEVVRTPDGATVPNEFDYQNQIENNNDLIRSIGAVETHNSPTYAGLRLQYYFSDDFYTDLTPVLLDHGHELSVPDMPGGRLVEKPWEIMAYLDVFLASDGAVVTGQDGMSFSSLTTGYSFLSDQAEAVDSVFEQKGIGPHAALITDLWGKNDLLDIYFYEDPPGIADINAINAHFDHWRTEPATIDELQGLVHSEELAPEGMIFDGTIFFSVGCHMNMNFPDEDAVNPADPGTLDFAQALLSQGITVIGNWGFGYGDDAALAYSEELMLGFARYLGDATVGNALVEAKREYLLNQALLDPVHEKVLMETIFYGLPMWQLSAAIDPLPEGNTADYTYDSLAGNTVRKYEVDLGTMTPVTVQDRGTFYQLAGRTQAALYRPIQPKTSVDVSGEAGQVAHGVLFTGGTYSHTANFDPAITMPTWTRTTPEPQFVYEGWDPARFWSLAQLERGDGSLDEELVLVPGQFLTDEAATIATGQTIGTQRLYGSMNFDVIYASEALEFQKPVIKDVSASLGANQYVMIEVKAADPLNESLPNSGIVKVIVAYTEIDGGSSWSTTELHYDSLNEKWTGSIQVGGPIDFFVQAVDNSGNVGMYAGNGYFTPAAVSINSSSTAVAGLPVNFGATASDAFSDPHYYWDFGDGSVETGGPNPIHTYNQSGSFEVIVKVVDAAGNMGRAATLIAVDSPLDALMSSVEDPPPGSFREPAEDRQHSLQSKLASVGLMMLEQNYTGAIQKLTQDIRPKMDGCGIVADQNDWIIDCSLQITTREVIDELITILEDLASSST